MTSKLFIANLSWNVDEGQLLDLFSQVGEVVSVTLPINRHNGKRRGFGFIEMATPEEAEAAIGRFHQFQLDGRDMVVTLQDESRVQSKGGAGHSEHPPAPNPSLFVRNISPTVREEDLSALFQQAGQVISVKIPFDRMTGQQKTFGFIEMSSIEQAQAAIDRFNDQEIAGQVLAVAFSDPSRQQRRPVGSSSHQWG